MFEFALVFALFMMIIGITIDLSLTYFRYNLLTFVSQRVVRGFAADLQGNHSTSDQTQLKVKVVEKLESTLADLGASYADFDIGEVKIVIEGCGTSQLRCYLQVDDVRWKSFSGANLFWNASFYVTTESKVLIEDPCFICADELCS